MNQVIPKVSVIIPTYNAEKTIERAVHSIQAQTYESLEIICCDDYSTDNTVAILKHLLADDPRITVLTNEENRKAAYTRNRCIAAATGVYITQLDDDDYAAPERIEKQVIFLEQHPQYAFVGSSCYLFDENGVWGERQTRKECPVKQDFLWSSCFLNSSVTFRKEALETVGGYRISSTTVRSQDYDLYMRLYTNGFIGCNMTEKLLYYYRGKNSISKCKYKHRINEAKIRYYNYKRMGLLPKGFLFVIKPLVVGLIPFRMLEAVKRVGWKTKHKSG